MISAEFFIEKLRAEGVEFYTGVPDSLLKNVCAYITNRVGERNHIIAANEGGAVALAAGYHLATGRVGCVYMQNSGEGNAINPLASLTDSEVYHIPLLLLIGWRGQPGRHDEPQHVKQGKITTGLLNTMGIDYTVLSKDEETAGRQVEEAMRRIRATGNAYALVVEKDTFEAYSAPEIGSEPYAMHREEAIIKVACAMGEEDVAVATTGMISRELYEYREAAGQGHERDFLTVGSMGHASMIATGIALHGNRRVWCFDGDGATLMHMGGMAIVASLPLKNLIHVVFNNGAHDSVGGQPTVGLQADLCEVAQAVGYRVVKRASSADELDEVLHAVVEEDGPVFVEVRVRKGNRKDLGRPKTTPIENKVAFMDYLKQGRT